MEKKQQSETSHSESEVIYFGYDIPHKGYSDVVREANPDEEYDADDIDTTWDIENKLIESNSKAPDIVVPFRCEGSKDYYLVYVIYSTGDSFHNHQGYSLNFIELFETKSKADELKEIIIAHNKNYEKNQNLGESSFTLTYNDEKNNVKNTTTDWNGYFESIDTVEVITVQTNALKNKIKKIK